MTVSTIFNSEGIIPFEEAVALGLYDGIIPVLKYGLSVDIDTDEFNMDVWTVPIQSGEDNNQIKYLSDFSDIYMASSNDTDTQDILVIGMYLNPQNQWELIPEICPLTGNTPVKLQNQFIRIVRAFNNNGTPFLGDVWFTDNNVNWLDGVPTDYTEVQAHIPAASQQTLMSHMTIPENYYGLISDLDVGIVRGAIANDSNAAVELVFTPFGGVPTTKLPLQLNTRGTGYITGVGRKSQFVDSRTDIKFNVTGVGRSPTSVTVNYNLRFFRKDRLPAELISILP